MPRRRRYSASLHAVLAQCSRCSDFTDRPVASRAQGEDGRDKFVIICRGCAENPQDSSSPTGEQLR